jgi:hypothetical protein
VTTGNHMALHINKTTHTHMKTSIVAMTVLNGTTTTHIVCTDMHMEPFSIVMHTTMGIIKRLTIVPIGDEAYTIPFTSNVEEHIMMNEIFGPLMARDMMCALSTLMEHELIDVDVDSFLEWYNIFMIIDEYTQNNLYTSHNNS